MHTRCGTRNENRFQIVLKATVLKVLSCNFLHFSLNLFEIITQGLNLNGSQIQNLMSREGVESEILHAEILFALTLKACEPAN